MFKRILLAAAILVQIALFSVAPASAGAPPDPTCWPCSVR